MFRLNVDGVPGNRATEVPVLANDSVHLFVEVTVVVEEVRSYGMIPDHM